SLKGTGVNDAALTIDSTGKDFGTQNVRTQSSTTTFKITNTGDLDAGKLVTSLTANAGTTSDFTITDGCVGAPLPAGKTCNVVVAFSPQTTGSKSLTITVSGAPGGPVGTTVTGNAVDLVTLTVDLVTQGSATVTSDPSGISCQSSGGGGGVTCSK